MSIHTILSQEIEKIKSEYDLQKASVGRNVSLTTALEAFATRIVEEVGKELIGEDEWTDPDINDGYNEDLLTPYWRNKFRASQRTKLQKMKEVK